MHAQPRGSPLHTATAGPTSSAQAAARTSVAADAWPRRLPPAAELRGPTNAQWRRLPPAAELRGPTNAQFMSASFT